MERFKARAMRVSLSSTKEIFQAEVRVPIIWKWKQLERLEPPEGSEPLEHIEPWTIERWTTRRLRSAVADAIE
jgi:hypothetical protein